MAACHDFTILDTFRFRQILLQPNVDEEYTGTDAMGYFIDGASPPSYL
jgi:hypothetical protein